MMRGGEGRILDYKRPRPSRPVFCFLLTVTREGASGPRVARLLLNRRLCWSNSCAVRAANKFDMKRFENG